MQTKYHLDALNERAEQLLQSSDAFSVSETHRRRIVDKFANKSLQELHEFVSQLNPLTE